MSLQNKIDDRSRSNNLDRDKLLFTMDRESLLALIEKNQGAGLIYVDELPDNHDPELPQMIEE